MLPSHCYTHYSAGQETSPILYGVTRTCPQSDEPSSIPLRFISPYHLGLDLQIVFSFKASLQTFSSTRATSSMITPVMRDEELTNCRGHGARACGPCGRRGWPHALGIGRPRCGPTGAVIAILARQILQDKPPIRHVILTLTT
jgi:hypothetical protein